MPALPSDIGNRFPAILPGLMIVCAAPPLLTCRLPGPWHDSQPMFFAFSPFAFSRACVAVRKSRVISS